MLQNSIVITLRRNFIMSEIKRGRDVYFTVERVRCCRARTGNKIKPGKNGIVPYQKTLASSLYAAAGNRAENLYVESAGLADIWRRPDTIHGKIDLGNARPGNEAESQQ